MTIDIHVHVGSFESLEGAAEMLRGRADVAAFRTRHPEIYARFAHEPVLDNSAQLLTAMDENDIAVSLVQPRPGVTNEFVSKLATADPSRLVPLALPTPWPTPQSGRRDAERLDRSQEVADTALRCIEDLGMRAVGELYVRHVTSEIHPERIADSLTPLMEVLERHRAPVQIPTAWTQFPGGLVYGDPLWVDELAARFPTVPIVLTKMGRGLTRFFEGCLVVALRNSNIYFDTSDTSVAHLTTALDTIGPERVMYGSDWSATWQFMQRPGTVHETAQRTITAAVPDPGVRRQILHKTAARVYSAALS